MSVEAVLDKITDQHDMLYGCVYRTAAGVYHNLKAPYDLLDVEEVTDYADNLLSVTRVLDDPSFDFDSIFVEYAAHSVIAKSVESDILLLLGPPISRAGYKKAVIGLGLFDKPLMRAAAKVEAAATEAKLPTVQSEPEPKPVPVAEIETVEHIEPGPQTLVAERDATPPPTVLDVTPEEIRVEEVPVPTENDPSEGGKKKRRIYRGVVFWE
ncbi:MAG: hypothetical protein AAF713_10795 [Pseudomonadota bacterium]